MKYDYHKDGTTPPQYEDYIFVFGSNLSGIHGAGAAKEAYDNYGAIMGKGEGLMFSSYAIPTKGKNITFMALVEVVPHIKNFLTFAKRNPEMKFWMTSVGCGLAGFSVSQIASYFENATTNINFPDTWKEYLE
jgi:hypothetical protein